MTAKTNTGKDRQPQNRQRQKQTVKNQQLPRTNNSREQKTAATQSIAEINTVIAG
jgi:hypothetical protein